MSETEGLRAWCEARCEEQFKLATDPKLAEALQLHAAGAAAAFSDVMERLDLAQAGERQPPKRHNEIVDELWQDLVEKDDRTSPAEYPEMALINRDELSNYIAEAMAEASYQAALAQAGASRPVVEPIGHTAEELVGIIYQRDAEYERALENLTITPDASSQDELSRSIYGAMQDCPAMSSDKIADFIARALWPAIAASRPVDVCETCNGRGEIGGFDRGDNAWRTEPCPECASRPVGGEELANSSPTPSGVQERLSLSPEEGG